MQETNNLRNSLFKKLPWDLFILSYLANSYQKSDLEELRKKRMIIYSSEIDPSENDKLLKIIRFILAMHGLYLGIKRDKFQKVLEIEKIRDEVYLACSELLTESKEDEKLKSLQTLCLEFQKKYEYGKWNLDLELLKVNIIDLLGGKEDGYYLERDDKENGWKISLSLEYDDKLKKPWDEIFPLQKISRSHNYNLLKPLLSEIVNYFLLNNKNQPIKEKVNCLVLSFTDKPDIVIKSQDENIKIGLEITEIPALLTSLGSSVYKKLEDIMKNITKKGLKELKDLEEFVKVYIKPDKEKVSVAFGISKGSTIDDLMDNSKSAIRKKETKWAGRPDEYKTKLENTALLLPLPIHFLVHLKNKKTGKEDLSPEMQKDYLSYFYLEKIHEKFKNFKNIKFGSLIIIFLNRWMHDLRWIYNPFLNSIVQKKREENIEKWFSDWDFYSENEKEASTSLYFIHIPIVLGRIKDLQGELAKKKKQFTNKWKCAVDDIEYCESPPIYTTISL